MGVPAFFRKLTRKYKLIRKSMEKPVGTLYIDANCLFHPQCFKELSLNKDINDVNILFDRMSSRIINYIDYIINLIKPEDLVYIAVDGVAPVAKINQQRMRRFASAHNYKYNIYRKYGIKFNDNWSNIVITPGTQFMYDLHIRIKSYYVNFVNTKCPKFKILYNSYLSPGEGEHKILQHIKENISITEKRATVIYGLDADLIFLSMSSQRPNIFLLREVKQFDRTDDDDGEAIEEELCFADIDFTKRSINNEFNEYYKKYIIDGKINKKNICVDKFDFINDYIFICYFLGNDFLPHLPSIDIDAYGLETILDVYIDIFQNMGTNLISFEKDNININNVFLIEFIASLASKEEHYFRNVLPEHMRRSNNRKCFETERYKKEIWNTENLKNCKIVDKVRLGHGKQDEWKYRYYSHYFKTDEHMGEMVDDICHNYLEGLLWVTRYYFEKCVNWKWQYNYTHAPFLSDIMTYISNKNIMKDFDTNPINEPVDIYTQLLSVVPPDYTSILPDTIQHLNNSSLSPIVDMFPLVYELDMINKTQLYKCIPIIPHLDIERVESIIQQTKFSELDMVKSRQLKIIEINRT